MENHIEKSRQEYREEEMKRKLKEELILCGLVTLIVLTLGLITNVAFFE
jgi:hypothetical protein